MIALEKLAALARAAGAERAVVLRSRGGLLNADPPVSTAALEVEDLAQLLQDASPVTAPTMDQLAQALAQILAVPRRREGARGNVLRLHLGRSPAELVLFRGETVATSDLLPALAALENEALSWAPTPELRAACSFVALDDRTTMLMDGAGEILAMSASMRRALGAEASTGTFVAPPRRRQFLDQVRALAAGTSDGAREEARGLAAPGVVGIDRHVQRDDRDVILARVLGPADLHARIASLSAAEMTPREIACGVELAYGKSYRAIGDALQLSPDTVKLHLRAVYQKLGVSGREQYLALLAGILVPPRRVRG